jgi:AraC-like DNA-binding protein
VVTATDGVVFSEAKVFSEWHALVSAWFVQLEVAADRPNGFHGSIRIGALDGVSLSEINAACHSVQRTPALIARGAPHMLKLSLQLSGTGLLIQDGREAVLSPGDLAVYDTNRPYSLAFDDDFRGLVLMFPHDLIALPREEIEQLSAVRMAGNAGLGRVISPFLVQLARNLDQLTSDSGLRLVHNTLDLVTTMFISELGAGGGSACAPNHELLGQVRRYIDDNLGDPDLTPTKVAAAHYISARHLHTLFRPEGTTVATWIRARRLERCRRDLRDPAHATRPIAALAARWGFLDASHFSRLFKATYDVPPSTYRARALGPLAEHPRDSRGTSGTVAL